jgi:hypothetical protein
MKKKLYMKAALSLMAIALLSSCLKRGEYSVDFTKDTQLVELPGAANVSGTAGPFEVVGITASATGPSPFPVAVNLAAPNPLSKSITVTLSENAAALTAYNNANMTSYTLLPAADFNSTALSVTIPAGQNLENLTIEVNTSALDPTMTYVLPLTITNGDGIQISNYNTILYQLVVKNAYDDNYTESGYKFHPSAGASHALTGTIPVTTVTATTSQTAVGDLGGSGYFFNFDVSSSNTLVNFVAVGSTPTTAAFLTTDNPTGTVYPTTDGTSPGKAPYVQATYNNFYDPAKKTFWMHYGYPGANGERNFYAELVAQ